VYLASYSQFPKVCGNWPLESRAFPTAYSSDHRWDKKVVQSSAKQQGSNRKEKKVPFGTLMFVRDMESFFGSDDDARKHSTTIDLPESIMDSKQRRR
jgi:hypothetical protein